MMNTFVFIALGFVAQLAVVWIAYSVGHESGHIDGWEQRRRSE